MTRHATFVISGLEQGGAERQLVDIANTLAFRGWNVTVVSYLPFSDTSLRSDLNDSNVNVISLNSPTGMGKYVDILKAARAIRRSRPDILVGFMFHGIMTARIVGRLTGVPAIVSSIHNERDSPFREKSHPSNRPVHRRRHHHVQPPGLATRRQARRSPLPHVRHSQRRRCRTLRHEGICRSRYP